MKRHIQLINSIFHAVTFSLFLACLTITSIEPVQAKKLDKVKLAIRIHDYSRAYELIQPIAATGG